MKKRVFISVALWGNQYAKDFVNFSIGTLLSKGNIPAIASECEVTYEILTTSSDKEWMQSQEQIKKLAKYCNIEWLFIEELYPENFVSGKIIGDKYTFLSALQNHALKRASKSDIIIFNYADFIWADGSISNIILDFIDDVDAIMTFCMRVKDREVRKDLKKFENNGVIEVSPRTMADICLRHKHPETQLNYWDNKEFTSIPTSLIWPVGDEGIVIHAYHQTILALRVNPKDPLYHNGIITTSLDGYYSAVLAANRKIIHAKNSDKIFGVSLCGNMPSSKLPRNISKEKSLRNCLRWSVSKSQRSMAMNSIEVRRAYKNPELWKKVKDDALSVIEDFHRKVAFIPSIYSTIYRVNRSYSIKGSNYIRSYLRDMASKLPFEFRALLIKIITRILIPNNVAFNGNFDQRENTWYAETKKGSILVNRWLGWFDSNVQGRFDLSQNVPNNKSRYSLKIEGANGADKAYLIQKIEHMALTHIYQREVMTCSGYIRIEGDVNPNVVFCVAGLYRGADEHDTNEHYSGQTITIKNQNQWQYFEITFDDKEFIERLTDDLVIQFRMEGLSSPDSKVYFSQIQFEAKDKASRFVPRTHKKEKWISFRIAIIRWLKEQENFSYAMIIKSFLNKNKNPNYSVIDEEILKKETNPNALIVKLRESERLIRKQLYYNPLYINEQFLLAKNLWFQGKFELSMKQFFVAYKGHEKHIEKLGLEKDLVLLPTSDGRITENIDSWIKQKILNDDSRSYHLEFSDKNHINKAFLQYFEPHLQFTECNMDYLVHWNWAVPEDKKSAIYSNNAKSLVQTQWKKEGRSPICKLKPQHKTVLDIFKADCGMKEEDWFVFLHVDSTGFHQETEDGMNLQHISIEDYFPAIQQVLSAGGWVIYLGDKSIAKTSTLPKSVVNKVIDYKNHIKRNEEMDLSLIASCRLFIATGHNLYSIAQAFGRPVCFVNVPLLSGFPGYDGDIFLPMLYYSIANHKILNLKNILSSDLVYADKPHLLAFKGIALLQNTPDEIKETFKEALSGNNYQIENSKTGEEARNKFIELNQTFDRKILGRISLYFSTKYAHELFLEKIPGKQNKEDLAEAL